MARKRPPGHRSGTREIPLRSGSQGSRADSIAVNRCFGAPVGAPKEGYPEIASGARGAAHQADGIELGLFARSDFLAFAHLVALIEQLDLLHLLEGLAQGRL